MTTTMASATGQTLVDLVDHLRGMETSFTTILFETALKLANIADTSVFLLVETAEGRKFGGKKHLCDSYVGDGLKSLSNDTECSLDPSINALQLRHVGLTQRHQSRQQQQQQQNHHPSPLQRQQLQQQQQQQPSHSASNQSTAYTSFSSQAYLTPSTVTVIPDVQSSKSLVHCLPRLQEVGAVNGVYVGNGTSIGNATPVGHGTFLQPETSSLPPVTPSAPSPLVGGGGGSSNKRKQSRPKSLLVNLEEVPPLKMIKTLEAGDGGGGGTAENYLRAGRGTPDNDDVIEIKREPVVPTSSLPLENGGVATLDSDSCRDLDAFKDDFNYGYDAIQGCDGAQGLDGGLAYDASLSKPKRICNDLDGMVLDLLGGNQSVVVWNVRNYLASNMKVSAMLTLEPLIDTHVDPSGRELKKHSAFMKMLSSVLYDASKEAAIACPVKCKSDPSSKNFFSVVFEDLFAFFPNLNDLHVRGFRCPEGTRSYSVKTFCRNIMQRSFGFFLDKMR